jgi:hypothetical protein
MKNLYAKLLAVQKDIQPIERNENNPYFGSKYFSVDTVISELKPLLNKYGLVVLQPLGIYEGHPILITSVLDPDSGEKIETYTQLPQNPDPQKYGAIITYFRRYALVSMFLLQGETDDDANSVSDNIHIERKQYINNKNNIQSYRPTEYLDKNKIINNILSLDPNKREEAIKNIEKTNDWTSAEIQKLRERAKYEKPIMERTLVNRK